MSTQPHSFADLQVAGTEDVGRHLHQARVDHALFGDASKGSSTAYECSQACVDETDACVEVEGGLAEGCVGKTRSSLAKFIKQSFLGVVNLGWLAITASLGDDMLVIRQWEWLGVMWAIRICSIS